MKYIILFLVSILPFSIISIAQTIENDSTEMKTGIVYGKDHAFSVTAPNGWILDNHSGVQQGIYAVFYPTGGSWENSTTVMYVNTASKNIEGNETVQSFITKDSLDYSDTEIKRLPTIWTGDKKEARVLSFFYSNYDVVAYIDEPKIIAMIIMTARNKKDYEDNLSAFTELVGSYLFLTSDVNFNK